MGKASKHRDTAGMAALQDLLEGALAGLDMGVQVREQAALRAWASVAGRVVAAHTQPEAMRDGVLIVVTDSPAWAQELHMRQTDLLARLNPLLGGNVVREIRFRSGLRKRTAKAVRREATPAEETLSEWQTGEVRAAAAQISDRALRERAEKALTSMQRIGMWRRKRGWRQCSRCGQWQRTGRRWCVSCTYRRGEGA